MYSQGNEEEIILEFFKDKQPGRFWDIGAYDGKTFSNTRALFERGWEGLLVEASPQCFVKLQESYRGHTGIDLLCAAVDTHRGFAKFYDSAGAVASLNKDHMEKWKKDQGDFMEIWVPKVVVADLLPTFGSPQFVSLDIEGKSVSVLAQFPDLQVSDIELFCVEVTPEEQEMVDHIFTNYGFTFLTATVENRFYRRV